MSDEAQESLSEIIGNRFGGPAKAEPPKPATGEPAAKPAEAAPPAAAKEPPAEPAEKPDRARDESGKFKKAETVEEKPAEKPVEKPRPDVAAIIDERRKRQEAEKRYADLLAQSQKPTEKPSVFDNEDAAIASRVTEGTRGLRESLYKMSMKTARAIYKDFAEAESAFAEAMERDPRLIVGLQQSDDPGEYVYTMGIHVRELADVGGDLMKYREKVTAGSQSKIDELTAANKALQAQLDELKKAQADLESVPRSLNNTSSVSAPKAGDEDPEDIRSIARFGNQRR